MQKAIKNIIKHLNILIENNTQLSLNLKKKKHSKKPITLQLFYKKKKIISFKKKYNKKS